ncbi:hypothetical protein TanjilG_23698 [Lupinus angustifolius]|uniref:Uncharacterized protein n=1 Tax=Lupinus angustifolius TaxID=3871 RepID=A0A4P1RAF1_LUPAN|nr:hypothetical protein TanjilG_23698 [Lupinus angustifolius]
MIHDRRNEKLNQHSASPNVHQPEAHNQLSDRGALTVSSESRRIMTEAHECPGAMLLTVSASLSASWAHQSWLAMAHQL